METSPATEKNWKELEKLLADILINSWYGYATTVEKAQGKAAKAIGIRSHWQAIFIAVIGITITGCEYVFAYHNVAYGIVIALALVIAIYLILSLVHFDPGIISCSESLALIPLYILFTSSLPWFFINEQYLIPAVYSCILGLCFWHIYQNNLSLRQIIGFSREKLLKYSLICLAIGIPTGSIEYYVIHPEPALHTFGIQYLFRDVIYMLLFVGFAEELLFRGIIQQDLTKAFGWKWGLVGASVLFAVMHLTWRSVSELLFVFIAGLILGGLYIKTKSLVAPIILHCVNNVMLVAILPYIYHP